MPMRVRQVFGLGGHAWHASSVKYDDIHIQFWHFLNLPHLTFLDFLFFQMKKEECRIPYLVDF